MAQKINKYLEQTGGKPTDDKGQMARIIFESLAIIETQNVASIINGVNKERFVMKGNEKDCICHKSKGKHLEKCDAYRLSQFLIKAGGVLASKK